MVREVPKNGGCNECYVLHVSYVWNWESWADEIFYMLQEA